MEFSTRTIHAAQPSEPGTGSLIAPIFQTATYEQEEPGVNRGFDYSRTNNPTRARLEAVLADLEGVSHAAVFASGLAAENAILQAYLKPGDEIIVPLDVYGGTYRLLTRVYAPAGCGVRQVDVGDEAALDAALTARTRLVWIESPTNPRLLVYDIARICRAAHASGGARRGRQHLCVPGLSAAVPARRGSGRPQRHEVPRRPLGRDPGCGAGARRRGLPAGEVPAERDGGRALPLRLLADAAGPQDAGTAHGAPRPQRGSDRAGAAGASSCEAGVLPRPACPPGARHRGAADERLRRHGVVRAGRLGRRGGGLRLVAAVLRAW